MEFFGAGGRVVIFNDAAAGYGDGDNFDGDGFFYVLCFGGAAKNIGRIRHIRHIGRIGINRDFSV